MLGRLFASGWVRLFLVAWAPWAWWWVSRFNHGDCSEEDLFVWGLLGPPLLGLGGRWVMRGFRPPSPSVPPLPVVQTNPGEMLVARMWLRDSATPERLKEICLLQFIGIKRGLDFKDAGDAAIRLSFRANQGDVEHRNSIAELKALVAGDPDLATKFAAHWAEAQLAVSARLAEAVRNRKD